MELAGELLTMTEVARTLSAAWGVPVEAPTMTLDEALAAGMPAWGAGHVWSNAILQPARPELATQLGIPVTTFATWAQTHLTRAWEKQPQAEADRSGQRRPLPYSRRGSG